MSTQQLLSVDQLLGGLGPIIFESIKLPFGIFDKDHRVLWANEELASLHQIKQDDLVGNICHEICHGKKEPCTDCHIETVLKTGKTHIVERWFHFPARGKVWGEVHYYPIRGNDGDIAAVIIFGFDVTDKNHKIEVLNNYSKYLSDKLFKNNNNKIVLEDDEITLNIKLTNREHEILRLLTEGYTNTQIGSLLSISNNTVKTHINSIFNKLGVNDRTQAAVIATRQNLV